MTTPARTPTSGDNTRNTAPLSTISKDHALSTMETSRLITLSTQTAAASVSVAANAPAIGNHAMVLIADSSWPAGPHRQSARQATSTRA